MTAERAAYHHGDLPRAVLTAALDVIATEGPAALSLRGLARRAGVSHAAPAHHFGDRAGLLTAIATEGYGLLSATFGETRNLRDLGVRYVRFAIAHPAHFQVMFRPELLRPDDPELLAARERTRSRLRVAVAGYADDPAVGFMAAWSMAHGFASLLLSHNLDGLLDGQDPEEAFRALTGDMFRPAGDSATG
ncbi:MULTISPECIES: TetR/AcrR family transcriptional regulator [unclassified Streptomyces]|uniref:TetR/AcrR family transcriptional regulator n=1 Tax=unclassified Streptomyces TaxID=2593676 RepID=UPI002442094E|nr:TetR/AcrR family transcriptional regulator [Streptomyces sp. DH41]MDG9725000.1 TetR/AcrR family transcriptional regulator [Streptomyces sp. DH41]